MRHQSAGRVENMAGLDRRRAARAIEAVVDGVEVGVEDEVVDPAQSGFAGEGIGRFLRRRALGLSGERARREQRHQDGGGRGGR